MADLAACDQLERDLIGWQLKEPVIAEYIRSRVRGLFSDQNQVFHDAIQRICQGGGTPTPATIAGYVAGLCPEVPQSTILDYLRQCEFGSPAHASIADLEQMAQTSLDSLKCARQADRRQQADDLLRQKGAEGFAVAAALLDVSAGAAKFSPVPFDQLDWSDLPEYLIQGLLPLRGLAVLYGPPKCGKSFLAFDMAMHIALGWKYRDRYVEQGAVAYLALEGASGYAKRAAAFREKHQLGDGRVPLLLFPIRLDLVMDKDELIHSIDAALDGVRPRLVVIDTLNRSLTGSESSDEDMAAYISAAQAVQERLRCAVLIVHHSGVDESRPRGHTSLGGAVDTQISVKREKGSGIIMAKVERQKDDGEGEPFSSRLVVVELGKDVRGAPVTSCVVEPVEETEAASPPRSQRLTDRQRAAMDALTGALNRYGQLVPAAFGLPGSVQAVAVDDWRQELIAKGVVDKASSNPRADFKRLKVNLQAAQLIVERDGLIWPMAR